MKARTNEEKIEMLNQACDLFNEAAEKIREAKRLFHLCGIEFCNGLNEEELHNWDTFGCNLHIFRGMKKMEKILGIEGTFHKNYVTEKIDRSRKYIRYKDLEFMQLGNGKETLYTFK